MDLASVFEDSLPGNVGFHATPPREFVEMLNELVTAPAVGVPLGFEEASLGDAGMNTDPTPREVLDAETGVTPAGLGVADYGSITIASEGLAEYVSLYPPKHIAVLREEDIERDMPSAFSRLEDEFRRGRDTQVLATGPSATADMGTLVHGVHGPRDVDILLVEALE